MHTWQRLCVGTMQVGAEGDVVLRMQGARTPARLPAAVEEFLQERGMPFTQPERGLLEVSL